LRGVIGASDSQRIARQHYSIKDDVIGAVGTELDGFKLDDLVIEVLSVRSRNPAEEAPR
jgi:hypothetical protein